MAARNDITGAEIKSKVLSREGRENWDNIFGKKSAFQWMEQLYGDSNIVKDINGWPGKDSVYLDTPITRADFDERFAKCTLRYMPNS